MRKLLHYLGIGVAVLSLTTSLFARTNGQPVRPTPGARLAAPAHGSGMHDVGKIKLTVSNNGTLGGDYASVSRDIFSQEVLVGCEYPKGSNNDYLFGAAFWIGAIVGRDTLVSTGQDGWQASPRGAEMNPDEEVDDAGNPVSFKTRSTLDPTKPELFENAISEEDFISLYNDQCLTCAGTDIATGAPHTPLNIEITQRSFSWSYSYAEDLILFDYEIKNVGFERLRKVYMGVYVDADVVPFLQSGQEGSQDDLCGFLKVSSAQYLPEGCTGIDTVDIAWIADNEGEFPTTALLPNSVPDVTATRIVRTPSDSLVVSFNWWVGGGTAEEFGPVLITDTRNTFTGGTGTPEGDRDKYHVMSNGENDYDQHLTGRIAQGSEIWKSPPLLLACQVGYGFDTRYLLSFGPFDIEPGGVLPVSFAYLAGEGLHDGSNDTLKLSACASAFYDPEGYYRALDFSDLADNSRWASWIYDNPGVDTDGDGDSGKARYCDVTDEKIYYQGDGVPDFRGASAPTLLKSNVRLVSSLGTATLRWNGAQPENEEDVFSNQVDFEGYRVYLSRDNRTYTLITSYDLENFNKYVYSPTQGTYNLFEFPYTLDSLRCLYAPQGCGDTNWSPLDYTRAAPFRAPGDSAFYFERQDYNQSSLVNPRGIRKRFPDAPKPPEEYLIIDSIPSNLRDSFLTEDKYLKYYEYEYTFTELLPTVSYYFSVTTFDFGAPRTGLPPLESSFFLTSYQAYPLADANVVEEQKLDVFVYPNPYRGDAGYLARGYEGRDPEKSALSPDFLKEIHFANLPSVCTIKIYTLDGDLVNEIEHGSASPNSNHEIWDIISRNRQEVVSGLYYWVVEEPNGRTQVGKLSIIL